MTVGDRIKIARRDRGLSQGDIARAMNISTQAVSQWENNKTLPEIPRLSMLANIIGVDFLWLFDESSPYELSNRNTIPLVTLQDSIHFSLAKHNAAEALSKFSENVRIHPVYQIMGMGFAVCVTESMQQGIFNCGDVVIFDNAAPIDIGDMVAAVIFGPVNRFYFRQFRTTESGAVQLWSLQEGVDPETMAFLADMTAEGARGIIISSMVEHHRVVKSSST